MPDLSPKLAAAVLVVCCLSARSVSAVDCPQPLEPATYVPKFRVEAPGQSIWPLDLADNVIFKPASSTPPDRNSTNYSSQCDPGVFYGTERFQDVAVLDDDPDWLFVATNSGLSVWNLAANPADPPRVLMRDGFLGQIETFPGPGEGDVYVEAIDAMTSPTGHAIYIAISGRSGHGLSIWRFTPTDGEIEQIFQEATRTVRDVELANHGGRTYAFASVPEATDGGLHVFDVSAADDLVGGTPCFDDDELPNVCPMHRGRVGDMVDGGYVDLLTVGGDLYAVASDGSSTASDPMRVEIWQLLDPADPGAAPAGASALKFRGLASNSRGVQLFEIAGRQFLAAIDANTSADRYILRAYDVSHCLDADGCAGAGAALWSYQLPPISGNYQYLSASRSGDRVFLYYGLETTPSSGQRLEQLFNVTALPQVSSGSGEVYEITDAGAEYPDPVGGQLVDYWGDYYSNNTYGLGNILPRNGRFQGDYFYRAAVGLLDVHKLQLPDDPTVVTVVDGPEPYWLEEAITFDTSVVGCQALAGLWCWLLEPAPGSSVGVSPEPLDLLTGCDPLFGGTQAFTFSCLDTGRCADTDIEVAAWNLGCGAALDGVQIPLSLTVKDPTVEVAIADPGTVQECTTASLEAGLEGRGPAAWQWRAGGRPIEGCDGSAGGDFDLSALGPVACSWQAESGVLFIDGFESGGCEQWAGASPGAACFGSPGAKSAGGDQIDVSIEVWDPAVGPQAPLASSTVVVPVGPIGDPSWVTPGDPVEVVAAGLQVGFIAAAHDTGLWSWSFQDPEGADTCSFPGLGSVACHQETTTGPEIVKTWLAAGTFRFEVAISNCRSQSVQVATGSVTLDPATQPDITAFELGANDPDVCCGSIISGLKCVAGTDVAWRVRMSEADPSFSFAFDWERTSKSDQDFVEQATPTPTADVYAFVHSFSNSGSARDVFPIVRAASGALQDTHEFLAGVSGSSDVSLTILPAGSTCE